MKKWFIFMLSFNFTLIGCIEDFKNDYIANKRLGNIKYIIKDRKFGVDNKETILVGRVLLTFLVIQLN